MIALLCFYSGLHPDGSQKVRAVDDMSISGINEATAPTEKLQCDTLDKFHQGMQALRIAAGKQVCAELRPSCRVCYCVVIGT